MLSLTVLIINSAFISAILCAQTLERPVANISQGLLAGKYMESAVHQRKYAAFLGIPYAKPPVGSLRFEESVPASSWSGTRSAYEEPPICVQMSHSLSKSPTLGSEDCLYLNVYTPTFSTKTLRGPLLDVIFYIHGGGFARYSGSSCDSKRVLDRDVVFVTLNYRLGALGFLSAQNALLPGNNGLKDQLLALKWVRQNIGDFGGDPDKITLAGMSAGAASVHYHVLSPLSKGLFKQVILESGSALNPWALDEDPVDHARDLALRLNCSTSDAQDMVECFKERSAESIILSGEEIKKSPHIPFAPVIEPVSPSAILTKHPTAILLRNEAQDVPMLFSFTSDEGLLMLGRWIADRNRTESLDRGWEAISPLILDFNHSLSVREKNDVAHAIRMHYLGNETLVGSVRRLTKMVSDRHFFGGIERSAKLHAFRKKSPVYVYEFDYKGKSRFFSHPSLNTSVYDGVDHIQNSLYTVTMDGVFQVHPNDELMAERILDIWIEFVKTNSLPSRWNTVQEGLPNFSFMRLNSTEWSDNKMETHRDFSHIKFWDTTNL